MRITEFGNAKSIFVNQDEGMFVAFPITFDEDVLTLETEIRNGHKFVKAGSLVLEVQDIKGITAEEYDITYGPVVGRVVLEGYAWRSRLTALALAGAVKLPRLELFPTAIDGSDVEGVPDYFALTMPEAGLVANVADLTSIKDGTVVALTVTIPEGKEVDTFTVGGVAKTFTDGKFDFTMAADTTVVLTFKDIVFYELTMPATGLVADAEDVTAIRAGTAVTVTVTIPEGKEVDAFTVDGTPQVFTDGEYTFTMSKDITIVLTFKDEL